MIAEGLRRVRFPPVLFQESAHLSHNGGEWWKAASPLLDQVGNKLPFAISAISPAQ
jgi:hypothetical protein